MSHHIVFRWLRRTVWIIGLAAAALFAFAFFRPPAQDLPWTEIKLSEPIGLFTARKLTALGNNRPKCLAILRAAGVQFDEVPPHGSRQCRITDAVRLKTAQKIKSGQKMLSLSPTAVGPSCPVVAGLLVWQGQVLQPAAHRIFGRSISRIEHLGSYSCRRLYGRSEGGWSEHATGNAIDISAFVLDDGSRISVIRDWQGGGKKATFLRAARDGACQLFSTVLSPDYNSAHRDHLHVDFANRGELGWRACR